MWRTLEWTLSGQEFVEHDAQTVLITGRADLPDIASCLFRRHIGRSPEDGSVGCHVRLFGVPLSQAEVHDLRDVVLVQHDVVRLDVAMDDAFAVCVRQRICQRQHPLGGLPKVNLLCGDPRGEWLTRNEFRGNEVSAIDLAALVRRHDVGVAQLCGGLCFDKKTLFASFLARRECGDLQCQESIQLRIERFVDASKASLPQDLL